MDIASDSAHAHGKKGVWSANNLNVVRILAALQVVVHHASFHLGIDERGRFMQLLSLFPGVPIFFFASGLLISRSIQRTATARDFARNRFLRLYPGLWSAFAFGVAVVFLSGYRPSVGVPKFGLWVLAQTTVVQFYNPQFMRGFGTGVLNGSLWTIVVELQFYVVLPMLVWALGRFRKLGRGSAARNLIMLALIAVFAVGNLIFVQQGGQDSERTVLKLAGVSFVPWIYMFLVGALVEENFDRVFGVVFRLRAVIALIALSTLFAARPIFGWQVANSLNPVVYASLATLTFLAAFCVPAVLLGAQRAYDVSYGLYLYHMPIVNLFAYRGWKGRPIYVVVVVLATAVIALISWKGVEQRALKKKQTVGRTPALSSEKGRETRLSELAGKSRRDG